ncbi:MAG: uroporphyrinogen decarboxylase family protein [bacterium]|nr:uroporphyrinogen decarboxylase family protein [bacterium]
MAEERFIPVSFDNLITLSFHPKYYTREFDADYGERYYRDPFYRIEQERKVARGYHRLFGTYGLGNPDPKPVIGVGIQPLDFMNGALGGRFVYQGEESVWTPDKPLANINNLSDMEALSDLDWDRNPVYQDFLRQIELLQRAFPGERVDHLQGVHRDGIDGKQSFLVMHTPYTTAFRLMGERIIEIMMLEEELARAILSWIMRQYNNLWINICLRMGWTGTKLHFGDCAATMLSPGLYQRLLLPMYQEVMDGYTEAIIHSCGPSTHLLNLFSQIPRVRQLQLGDGTDLRLARQLFPDVAITAYYSPARLLADSPSSVKFRLEEMCRDLKSNYNIGCSGVDPDTPEGNITAFLEMSRKVQA